MNCLYISKSVFLYKFEFLKQKNTGKNTQFIIKSIPCDILMSFSGIAANSAEFMHKGLLIPFARTNGILIVRKRIKKCAAFVLRPCYSIYPLLTR